ncbi:hypothetical protein D4764_0125750, partial [Takifugu flavidus]
MTSSPRPRPVQIGTEEVEGVQTYKYLELWLDNRLDWTSNTRQLYKKTQSRMYFLRRLRSFNICRKLLWMFYQSVVASVLSYAVVCWGGSATKADLSRLEKLIRRASSVVGMKLKPLATVAERRTIDKLRSIMDNVHHPLHTVIHSQRSLISQRLRLPKFRTNRLGNAFIPLSHQAVQLLTGGEEGQQENWNIFITSSPRPRPVQIGTEEVEGVQTYKYLELWLDNRLDWTSNTRQLYKKTQSRMYFLRRLRSFNICRKLLWMFYQSVVASVLSYAVVCWGGSATKADLSRLEKLIRRASSVVGMKLKPLATVAERRTIDKLRSIMDNVHHPLHTVIHSQRSLISQRLRLPKFRTNRLGNAFIPLSHQAVQLLTGG